MPPDVTGRTATPVPVSTADADAAFDGLDAYDRIVLAVSGGADSTALMHLFAAWAGRQRLDAARLCVVTVDHGLRTGSAAEAQEVAAAARALGLSTVTKTYTGPVPTGAFAQAWARDLRYRLLCDAAVDGLPAPRRVALVTAHHQDDQAETVLMRLARGSGIDGLGGIRRISRSADPRVDLVRPLLVFPKARLVATLTAAGLPWIEDPSNANPRFERVRLRDSQAARTALGLTPAHLSLAAHRAARASDALDMATHAALGSPTIATCHALGYARLSWPSLLTLPAEIRVRVLGRLLAWLSPEAQALGQLEQLTEGRHWQSPAGTTLQHCAFIADADADHVLLLPERGRLPRLALTFISGPVRFGPYHCAAPDAASSTLSALGEDGIKALKTLAYPLPPAPRAVLLAQPALFSATGGLLSAPTLGYRSGVLSAVLRPRPDHYSS